jgi:pyoverdine/dityrosine biosynthesis protein Dit1
MAILTKTQAEQKVYKLQEQLLEIKRQKSEANANYNEEIKDIESEIKAIIEEQHQVNLIQP